MDDMLDAPCLWCGYKGAGYWQTGTHDKGCPWYGIGGKAERETAFLALSRNQGKEIARLREENKRQATQLKRWFEWSESKGPGLEAYREMGQKLEKAERERDEAVRLLSDILSSEEDIDPRMRYVTCQIDRETLAQELWSRVKALLEAK